MKEICLIAIVIILQGIAIQLLNINTHMTRALEIYAKTHIEGCAK